jgi:hypothetical protein
MGKQVERRVNTIGLAEIKEILADRHAGGTDYANKVNLDGFALEAEESMANDNPPIVELRLWETASKHIETFTISEAGIDSVEIEVLE